MCYDEIAKGLHRRIKGLRRLPPPSIDDTLTGDDTIEAWRDEICRLASIAFKDHGDAMAQTLALRQHYGRAADRERRRIAGVEAQRLLGTFDKTTKLQDRVARMISQQLKSYRELQASRPTNDSRDENPRNDPNPNM
jgi:hypothetical protein